MDLQRIGPKMYFILRVYQMTETELEEEVESDRDLMRQGLMSQSEFWKRTSTRSVARKIREQDAKYLPSIQTH